MEGGSSSSASGGGVGQIEKWVNLHRSMYERATRHPFTVSISDGSVDLAAFKRWLISFNRQRLVPEPVAHMRAQDYIFVRKFVSFLASVLLKACKHSDDESDMEVLLGGMAYLSDELPWFRKEASKWGVSLLGVIPQKANLEYISFLESLMIPEVDFAIVATVFWAIEAVYQESFSLCLTSSSKTPDELTETCHRWGSETFGHYCRSLQKIADRCLAKAPSDVVQKAEEAFLSVLEHEINFWNMSYGE